MLFQLSKAALVAPLLAFHHFFRKEEMRAGYIPVMIDDYRVRNWTFWREILFISSKKKFHEVLCFDPVI